MNKVTLPKAVFVVIAWILWTACIALTFWLVGNGSFMHSDWGWLSFPDVWGFVGCVGATVWGGSE